MIIDQGLFERVQARLAASNPKVMPPRLANGPILLTGLATRAQKGATACKGNAIPSSFFDDNVLGALTEKLFRPNSLWKCSYPWPTGWAFTISVALFA